MRHVLTLNTRLTRRASLLLLLLIFVASPCWAERRERRVEGWRPINYDVALIFDEQLTELTSARTDISILILKDSLSTIDLDFGEMTIDAVTVNNQPVRFEHAQGKINLSLAQPPKKGERLTVSVKYHGRPKDGLKLTADKAGKPSATGDNWPDRVHHWIPCLEHPSAKATVRFTVTAHARNLVVANGQLTAKRDNPDNTRTWIYTEGVPIPPYCMIVAVGEFALVEPQRPALTPLFYYVPQPDREFAQKGFAPAPLSLELFTQQVAPYPYEKLALIVGATRFGGMENSSAIVFGSTFFDPRTDAPMSRRFNIRRGIVEVVAHEIAHQWFGDSVTAATWSDLWLSEGFATYFAGLFTERYEGREAFRDYMRRDAEEYFKYAKQRRAPIFDPDTENLNELLNENNYQKGSWVLHMLRSILGDNAFFRGIRIYYASHRNSTATTEDLRAALEKASGVNLRAFFQRWIYGSGHPVYELSWTWRQISRKGGVMTIHLQQTQTDAAFTNPVPVEITMPSGKTRTIIKPLAKVTIKRIPLSQQPVDVHIDPDETILKEVFSLN
ncbi:MAG: M1 family metallopeptidase [Pyrinomonadaceae bacterium]|nr:M1 family metallopeptidase [Pyrinomonadaceae bacterium]